MGEKCVMKAVTSDDLPENPREHSNFISAHSFWYTIPMFVKGSKITLNVTDLYKVLKEHKSEKLGNELGTLWDQEVKTSNGNPNLFRVLLRQFGCYFGFLGLFILIVEICFRAMQPYFLLKLISYFNQGSDSVETGYIYAGGLILTLALLTINIYPYLFTIRNLGFKIRVGLSSLVYQKALRLSRTALGDTTTGHVVNLISNDLGRLTTDSYYGHYLIVGPLQTLLITYLMYSEIGVAALIGVGFMMLFIPLNLYLGKQTAALRLKSAEKTDDRVRLMGEIISGIQVIKMYAWELPFERIVSYARKLEIKALRHKAYLGGITKSLIFFVSRTSIFISLMSFAIIGNTLSPQVAFFVTAYYNILKITLSNLFAAAITQSADYMVSLRRVQNFLQLEETTELEIVVESEKGAGKERYISLSEKPEKDASQNPQLAISGLKAKWDRKSPEYTLNGINLRVNHGSLLAVVGLTGSGKSSLIQAILGELPIESGEIKKNGSVSYAAQEPWLFSGTVRQNILFGQPMDHQRYWQVVKDCALERDFDLLPYKDQTYVGDRGASLSGGQKARISLARAVYREASIYLLDDPLSAVDPHVARHLFEKCIRGYLRDRIVILVTHQLQFLQNVDQILIMEKGQVNAVGTYQSLHESGLNFATMLADPKGEGRDAAASPSSELKSEQANTSPSLVVEPQKEPSDPEAEQMITQEHQETGTVGLDLYGKYCKAGGGFFVFSLIMGFCLLSQAVASLGDYFLNYWVTKRGTLVQPGNSTFVSGDLESHISVRLHELGWSVEPETLDTYIFTLITVLTIVVIVSRFFVFYNAAMRASIRLHRSMLHGVTRAAMYFFHTNPSGRILNRFTKDLGQLDEELPSIMLNVMQVFLELGGIVFLIAIVNPVFLLPTVVVGVIFYQLRAFYLKTSQDLKRIEAITRSPVYSHVNATLTGLTTIRAFGAQCILEKEFDSYQDMHSSAFYMFMSTSGAFGYWLEILCVIYIAVIALSFFIFPPSSGGDVGLAITQAMGMTGIVQWGMRQTADLENTMTVVERVVEYADIEPEGELEAPADEKPPETWPEQGSILFEDLSLRYVPDPKADNVLKSLSFAIKPREKVGIVGRTGAGKSSLINALFRLSYNDGSIIIDKRDTNAMGLHDLRSKISIIPQEPVLFSGSMRYNLDPFEEYSDEKLWRSLEEVKLKEVVADLPSGLKSQITEGGTNFSVGQRQLVCLARAILRENRILVMDEATANVDPQTDGLIQATIRNKFKECTVLTIAHRLHTIMDSDKVLVMDAGRVVEFGTPYELLTAADSKVFHGMVKQTGPATYDALLKIAQRYFESGKDLKGSIAS
ncbi:probable multidrug resistance-associated protein lethal(2)03659 [Drosophila bipectinata]|uniref:probable multidrug resistance-associated protein lethal(2)03659 n=1 Tax=Drosophila bipectinata TaxID=42026 RepID=UPI001C88F8E5|nr:probable multidrug resistance-associated protein lethal(2)03659 [Drosophila bipectinata]